MIGRVGRNPCQQLRGLLHSQKVVLMEEESRTPRDETKIAAIKRDIENTKQKMTALGCGDD
jgi:hypothetical protein